MALTSCPECHKEISDQAVACTSCGYPVKKAEVVIERTSKDIKEMELITGGVAAVGVLLLVAGLPAIGGFALLIGLVGFISVRASEWWHHG